MNNDALARIFPPETITKFELLAEVTSYQWYAGFERQLAFFRLLAFLLLTIEQTASSTPLESVNDAGQFLVSLERAEKAMLAEITALANNPDRPIEPQSPYTEVDRLTEYFSGLRYYLSDDWFARRAKILARGKAPLLSRIVARLAQQHTGQ